MVDTENKVYARGKIITIGKDYTGNPTIMLLIINSGNQFHVKFTLKAPLSVDIHKGSVVDVTGYVLAYNTKDYKTGKWIANQKFIAESVEPTHTSLYEGLGVEGRFMPDSYFKAFFVAQCVQKINSGTNWNKIAVRTAGVNSNEPNYVVMNYYTKGRLQNTQKLKRGDVVAVYCHIYTPKKNINGKEKSFENLILEDIAVLSKVNVEQNDLEEVRDVTKFETQFSPY